MCFLKRYSIIFPIVVKNDLLHTKRIKSNHRPISVSRPIA